MIKKGDLKAELDSGASGSGVRWSPFRNVPIKYRLPLLIGTLLLVAVGIFTWESYQAVRDSALEAGQQRLDGLSNQLASTFQQSAILMLNRTQTAANQPAVQSFLEDSTKHTDEVIRALDQFDPSKDQGSLQVELWTADRKLVLTLPKDGKQLGNLSAELNQCAREPFRAVGGIRFINETISYPAVATAKNSSGQTLGYLVRWRRLASSPDLRKQLSDLVGGQASLYFANVQGDVFSDLVRPVPPPPGGLNSTMQLTRYTREGNDVMALGHPIVGSPWFIVVELPVRPLFADADRFRRRMLLMGVIVLGFGLAAAILLSRNITRPLSSLTHAANAISSGDYSHQVAVTRGDELGTLGETFNTMVTRLHESQRELRLQSAALASAANGIMITDVKGKILWVNPAFTNTTGYTPEEAIGQTPRLLKSGKQDREFYKEMWDTILAGEVWRNTLINRGKDGTLAHEDLTITPIQNGAREITHFIAIKQDISPRVRAEEALRVKGEELAAATQQLWQASKLATMGELAASVAHELNNPLATIALRSELLIEQLSGDDGPRNSAEIILAEVERMADLVNNLLHFSRRSHRQISTVNVAEEIANSVSFISYYLRNRNVEVLSEFAHGVPTIQADRQQLRQLFLNLLTNAADAMPKGGKLITRTSTAPINSSECVRIEFIDSGTGIAPDHIERIWDSFFTTKTEGKGTGLGLAICRRIVEEHGGTIEIESELGQGTTVRMTFPATANGHSA